MTSTDDDTSAARALVDQQLRDRIRDLAEDRRPAAARLLLWITCAVLALAVMGELDRLVSTSVTEADRTYSLASVTGPLAFASQDAWAGWASVEHAPVAWWIAAYAAIDLVFIAAYARLGAAFIVRAFAGLRFTAIPAAWALACVVVLDALETVLLWLGASYVGRSGHGNAVVLAVVSTGKWLAVLVVAVALLHSAPSRSLLGRYLEHAARAVWQHRLSALVVAALFFLACVPSSGVLDQLPDIQRRWATSGRDWWEMAFAIGAVAVATLAAFALGRARTRRSVETWWLGLPPRADRAPGSHAWWLVVPLGWLFAYATARAAGGDTTTTGAGAVGVGSAWFWGILGGGAAASLAIARWRPTVARTWQGPTVQDRARVTYAWLVGDLVACAVLTMAGTGLVRSMTAVIALGGGGLGAAGVAGAVPLAAVGVMIALAGWLLMKGIDTNSPWRWVTRIVQSNDPADPRGMVQYRDAPRRLERSREYVPHRVWLALIMMIAACVLAVAIVWPFSVAQVGPVAVTVLLITAWTALLGAFTVALQDHPPLPIFRALGLHANPVLTFAIAVPLLYASLASLNSWDEQTHLASGALLASPGKDALPADSGLVAGSSDALDELLDGLEACEGPDSWGEITPVVMIAAEGGGIRAAYWTARVLDELRAEAPCTARNVVLASGVSGGSVGLAVTANADASMAGDADERLADLASSEPVAAAVIGLLDGDIIATGMGIRIPSSDGAGAWRWRDRAALLETAWMRAKVGVEAPYDNGPDERLGHVILNSTDANAGCRVTIGAPIGALIDQRPPCGASVSTPAATWWLPDPCLPHATWASAALLSARFPVISPAGLVGAGADCATPAQLVDGGYAENAGLGTLVDLAPQVNAAIARARAEKPSSIYFPMVVYVKSSQGIDLASDAPGLSAEPLAPLKGLAARGLQQSPETLLQQLGNAFGATCAPAVPCDDAAGPGARSGRAVLAATHLVVASPSTEPVVAPPLGWTLSPFAMETLDDALVEEFSCEDALGESRRFARLCHLP